MKSDFNKLPIIETDSLKTNGEKILDDSTAKAFLNVSDTSKTDSTSLKKKSKNAIEDKVDYKSQDSIVFDLKGKNVYLYKDAEIHYQNIIIKADYVENNFQTKKLKATGFPDSNGTLKGNPEFKEGEQIYKSKILTYNFDSKKGIINEVVTTEGEGFLHGYKVKKADEKTMYLSGGCYTTCDLEVPHFGIEFSKSKAIMGDRIITGPAYLSIENVPTPLVIPFGFFPFSKKRSSGVIIPSYGYAQNRGYYLSNGGYYFALSDYYDLSLLGDIYTNLSWRLQAESNYYKRYKYRGNVNISYEINKQGIKNTPDYGEFTDFRVQWEHRQDPKANPNSTFTANVNIVSSSYGKWSGNMSDYLTNTTSSSISYGRKLGESFNFTMGLTESFNSINKIYSFSLPSVTLSSKQFYLFRGKKSTGNYKWYEKINFRYNMTGQNNIKSPDSTLLKGDIWKRMDNGIKHNIPVNSTVRVMKYFNWDNNINYTERWYLKSIRKDWDSDSNRVRTDTVRGFISNRDISFSSSLNTIVYGSANFKNKYLKAVRHVMTPALTIGFAPGLGNPSFGYWKSYTDSSGMKHDYSVFEGSLYGGPPQKKSGTLGFRIGNNLEMKVFSKSDTVTGTRKIKLIENLSLSMFYDFAKDSLNLSPLSISGNTTLFNRLTIYYSGSFDPYCRDSMGNKYNQFLWTKEKKLFKRTNSSWNLSLNWDLSSRKSEEQKQNQAADQPNDVPFLSPFDNPNELLGNRVDFSVPWNLNIAYLLTFNNTLIPREDRYNNVISQTLEFRGDFNLTSNWKIGFRTGYDFELKEVTTTEINFYVDLHCWEMKFKWTPFGFTKGWEFMINVKANTLKDLKYEKWNSYRNTQPYL